MSTPIVIEYDKRLYKKCIKCRQWKPREDILDPNTGAVVERHGFGEHNSSDGLQSICFACKNIANKKSRDRNPVARIRHHTATRCLTQLGSCAPENFTAEMETYLGYKIRVLVKHLGQDLREREGPKRKLKDALNEGYHIDHIRPLSSFTVVYRNKFMEDEVDWEAFRKCWAITNLRAIPGEENLAKGAKHATPSRQEEGEEG